MLRIISGLEQGGAEEAMRKLLAHSTGRAVTSEVISLRPGGTLRPEIEALGVRVHDLGIKALPTPGAVLRLRAIVREFRPDVLEGWMTHGNLVASLARRLVPAAAVVWNVRSMLLTDEIAGPHMRALLRLSKAIANGPNAIVYNSGESAREHEAYGYPAASRHVIHNGFDLHRYRPSPCHRRAARERFGIPSETPVIGHVSRWHEHKDQRTLLRAFRAVTRARSPLILVMIGAGLSPDNAALTRLVRDLGIESSVRMLGPMRGLNEIYPMFDLFALSSVTEAFPNALGEAMSCGVPAIATDVGACREVLGGADRVAAPGDVPGLTALMLANLAQSPEQQSALSRSSRARIEAHFSIAQAVDRYATLYASLR